MRIPLDEIKELIVKAASRFVSPEEAEYFTGLSLEIHLRKSPRMNPLKEAVDDLENWAKAQNREIETLTKRPGLTLLDFQGLAPSLKIKTVHDILEEKARSNGVAALGFRNSAGIITLGMWADGLAGRGLIGLACFNGGVGAAVPPGGTKGVLGTNPLAFALPGDDGPLTLDMAFTEIPYFQIKQAKENGEELPPGAAVDSQGRPTQDPALAFDEEGVANLLPLGGGIKGFGLMLLIEVLTGALVGSPMSHVQSPGWNPTECGCFLLALDPGASGGPAGFGNQVGELTRFLKSQEPAEGSHGVSLPGERGAAKLEQALEQGEVEVEEGLLDRLKGLLQ